MNEVAFEKLCSAHKLYQSAGLCACLFRAKKLQPTCTSGKVIMVTLSLKVFESWFTFFGYAVKKEKQWMPLYSKDT